MDLIIISVAILSYFCPAQRMASSSSGLRRLNPNADTVEAMTVAEFLSTMLRDVWSTPGFRYDTEQAKKIRGPDSDNIMCEEDSEDIVFEKIAQWAEQHQGLHFYGERELLLHKGMWDIIRRDKRACLRSTSLQPGAEELPGLLPTEPWLWIF